MDIGDLVVYQAPSSPTKRCQSWLGLILGREGSILRIFWPDLGIVHEFGIGRKECWEKICGHEKDDFSLDNDVVDPRE